MYFRIYIVEYYFKNISVLIYKNYYYIKIKNTILYNNLKYFILKIYTVLYTELPRRTLKHSFYQGHIPVPLNQTL